MPAADVAAPPSDKATAYRLIEQMPESATLDQVIEELAILASIRRGEADADAGRVLSHEEVTRRSAAWIGR